MAIRKPLLWTLAALLIAGTLTYVAADELEPTTMKPLDSEEDNTPGGDPDDGDLGRRPFGTFMRPGPQGPPPVQQLGQVVKAMLGSLARGQPDLGSPELLPGVQSFLDRLASSQGQDATAVGTPPELRGSACLQNTDKLQDFMKEMMNFAGTPPGQTRPTTQPGSDNDDDDDDDNKPKRFDDLSDDAMACLAPMLDNGTQGQMCRKAAHMSSDGLRKLIHSGVNCVHVLRMSRKENKDNDTDDDDDDDDQLDSAKQQVVMEALRRKPPASWTDDDLDQALTLAPLRLEDDDIDDLDDDVFERNAKAFKRLLQSPRRAPGLDASIARKLQKRKPLAQMTSQDLTRFAAVLQALDLDDLDELSPQAVADVSFDDLDLDDDDPRGLALGRKFDLGRRGTLSPADVGRQIRFRKSDPSFTRNLTPDLLTQSLSQLAKEKFEDWEDDDLWKTLRRSGRFQNPASVSGADLDALGGLLEALDDDDDFLEKLSPQSLQASSHLPRVAFSRDTSKKLLKKLGYESPARLADERAVASLGRLVRGFDPEDFEDMRSDVLERALPLLEEADLDDSQKRAVLLKLRQGVGARLPPAVLRLSNMADSLSLDDLDDFSASELQSLRNVTASTPWAVPQAAVLVDRLRPALGPLDADDVASLERMAVGISTDDIRDLDDVPREALGVAETLGEVEDDLEPAQSEAMAEELKRSLRLDSGALELDERQALQAAPFLAYLDEDDLDKVRMTAPAKQAFVQRMSSLSTRKLSRPKMSAMARRVAAMVPNKDGTDDWEPSKWDEVKVRSLGELVAGLGEEDIRRLPTPAVLANLQQLERAPLSRNQAKAVVRHVTQGDKDWKCRRERLGAMGSLLQYVSDDDMKTVCKRELAAATSAVVRGLERRDDKFEERHESGFHREEEEDSDGRRRLVTKLRDSLADPTDSRRRRRNVLPLTCTEVKALGEAASLLEVTSLSTLSEADFRTCLEALGSLAWAADRLVHLAGRAKQLLGQMWTAEHVRQAGTLLAGMTERDIAALPLSSVDTLARSSRHLLLSPAQLKAGFARWLEAGKGGHVESVTSADLASMGEYVCGATASHIRVLTDEAIKGAVRTLGASRSCDGEQTSAYTARLVALYGQPSAWSTALVNTAGTLLGGLSTGQVQQLSSTQVSFIPVSAIPHLPPASVASMTTNQLASLSSNQATAVTQAQYNALSSPQRQQVRAKSSATYTTGPIGGCPSFHAASVSLLVVTVLTALWL